MNRDAWVAVALILFTGFMLWASLDIREPDYGVLPPSVWPRVILIALGLLSLVFLVQSLRAGDRAAPHEDTDGQPDTILGYVAYWRNPIICFVLFAAYLGLLPVLSMLLDGILFVFVLLCALGGWGPRQLALHATVAVLAVGGMWSMFTFGLNVLLPTGMFMPGF